MSITAEITKEALNNLAKVSAQFIPASIDGNGSAKIDEFNSYTIEEDNSELFMIKNVLQVVYTFILVKINSLRGYPMKGLEVDLPKNVTGYVLREKDKLKKEDNERELKFSGKFNKFMYWNYDKNPSENDSYRKALHWLQISEAVHTEVQSLDD